MKFVLASLLFVASTACFANDMKADAQGIDAACSQDAATTGCGKDKVGTGLLKCMHAYKKSHKEFKFSQGCKTALKKMREDRKGSK